MFACFKEIDRTLFQCSKSLFRYSGNVENKATSMSTEQEIGEIVLIKNWFGSILWCVCICLCVCACVRASERASKQVSVCKRGRERERVCE